MNTSSPILSNSKIKSIIKNLETQYTPESSIKVLMAYLLIIFSDLQTLDTIFDDKTGLDLNALRSSIKSLKINGLNTLDMSDDFKACLEQAFKQIKTELGTQITNIDGAQLSQDLRHYLYSHESKYELELTNEKLSILIGAILVKHFGLENGAKIYDGCAKTGEIFSWLNQMFKLKLYLEEHNALSHTLSQVFSELEGYPMGEYYSPKFFQSNPLGKSDSLLLDEGVDFYVSNPYHPCPLSPQQQKTKHAYLLNILSGRSNINRNSADALWIQLGLYSTQKYGQIILVVQEGFLSRPGYDKTLREYMTLHNLLDMIVFLPKSLSTGTQNPLAILVIDKSRTQLQHKSKVKMIDARGFGEKTGGYWSGGELKDFDAALRSDQTSGISHVIDKKQIIDNDNNWHIEHYINQHGERLPSIEEAELAFKKSKLAINEVLKS